MEVSPLQFIDKVVDTPVAALRQIHLNRNVQKTKEIPWLQVAAEMSVPAVLIVQVPQVQVVVETGQIPQLPSVEKIDETSEVQTVKEHFAVLAQLAARISAIMKFGAETGDGPFVKVKGSITESISRLLGETSSQASLRAYCNEGTSKATEKMEDLEAHITKRSSKFETAVDC